MDDDAAAFVNFRDRRRDTRHVRALSSVSWVELLRAAGLEAGWMVKQMRFAKCAENMSGMEKTREELPAQLFKRATVLF